MALSIPQDTIPGIVSIVSLPDETIDELVHALKDSSPELGSDALTKHVASKVSSVPFEQLTSILDTLYNLYYIREFSGVRTDRFLDDLVDGILAIPDTDAFQDRGRETLKLRFEKLMNISPLYLVSKASRLQRDGERLYFESKILSDIRPVFEVDPTVIPKAAVITHTLKIIYHTGDEHKEFHMVLDSEELESLKETIDRAALKDETLRALLKAANLSNLGA